MFPADVGVITNHQRQGNVVSLELNVLGSAARILDLGFGIDRFGRFVFLTDVRIGQAKRAERSGLP